jgi:hypothetical protein
MSSIQRAAKPFPKARASDVVRRLMYHDPVYLLSQLVDPDGRPLQVPPHVKRWIRLMTDNLRLVLLGPRDHSKSTTAIGFIFWLFFRHAIDHSARRTRGSGGGYLVLLLSATEDQAQLLMTRIRDLLAANAWLFPDDRPGAARLERPLATSQSHLRLASGAEIRVAAYGTSLRGMHPDLLVLDDVLNDENCSSERKRERTYQYFARTLLPMNPQRIVIVGTAIHDADLLHRLRPRSGLREDRIHEIAWHRYRALNEATGRALWPEQHSYAELARFRDQDPVAFAREFMNDARDELSTYFPRSLTQLAVDAGASLSMLSWYRKTASELVVMGVDVARSERMGADFTVAEVAAVDVNTGVRRVLTIRREQGLDFAAQLNLFHDLAVSFGVDWATIEDNGLQGWVVDELQKLPGGHVFHGHTTTGRGKMRFDLQGIPMLKLALVNGLWVVPSGDEASRKLARIWQDEFGAFGWRDGRVQGIGEHDDVVIASWKLEVALADLVHELSFPRVEIVHMEDIFPGWKPVRIGDYD